MQPPALALGFADEERGGGVSTPKGDGGPALPGRRLSVQVKCHASARTPQQRFVTCVRQRVNPPGVGWADDQLSSRSQYLAQKSPSRVKTW